MNLSKLNSEYLSNGRTSLPSNANVPTLPRVVLPFPPNITAYEIAHKRLQSNICSKVPNAFFIYRKVFVDHLLSLDHKFKMTEVSKLASENWKNESQEVISAYKKLSKQVEKELNNMRNKNLVYAIDIEKHKFVKRKERKSFGEHSISKFSINEKKSSTIAKIENSTNEINEGEGEVNNSRKILNYGLSPNFNSILDNNTMLIYDDELTISPIECEIPNDSYDYGHKKYYDPSTILNNSQDFFEDYDNLEWYLNDSIINLI
ncbi:hypothetical protein RclHR1_01720025 [Rhizophagus clarus]|uniref:HMG box domain-containing protein n=1 Tax=Rhizophagus clarus TaxID=94130 RepID=A0A2Z6QYF5_9GLOM|nr:hypothetical protein RclHR1_01720025 [Rhizophagus clarus]GES99584.1 hypothetical protein GLOIN_2v1541748 [Rhizophagus clarus]